MSDKTIVSRLMTTQAVELESGEAGIEMTLTPYGKIMIVLDKPRIAGLRQSLDEAEALLPLG